MSFKGKSKEEEAACALHGKIRETLSDGTLLLEEVESAGAIATQVCSAIFSAAPGDQLLRFGQARPSS